MKKFVLFFLILVPFSLLQCQESEYQIKDYSYLLGKTGLDDELMKMHFTLYSLYVKNTNALVKKVREVPPISYEFGTLKRRLSWEYDGMRLHELYFENLGEKSKIKPSSALYQALQKQFSSFEKWKDNFRAMGKIRGIGWVILYLDPQSKKLMNIWINEHDVGHLADGKIILVMDVFEHAYLTQFGLDRAAYIQTFFDHVKWTEVTRRFDASTPSRSN